MWQHELVNEHDPASLPSFAVLQPPALQPALGERLVMAASYSYRPRVLDVVVVVLDGSTGRPLSSYNLTDLDSDSIAPLGDGSDGYFTVQWPESGADTPVNLFRLLPDGSVVNATSAANATELLRDPRLLSSQYVLGWGEDPITGQSELQARDVPSGKVRWTSDDAFLVGLRWGSNDTYWSGGTTYQLLDGMRDAFLVLNRVYDSTAPGLPTVNGTTVLAQAGLYALSSGKQLARSPLLTLPHEHHTGDNPSTQQFGDMLVLRGDTSWFTLQLPQLTLVRQGVYATPDAWRDANNWLVDADGSYVALSHLTDGVRGHPPVAHNHTSVQQRLARAMQRRHMRHE